MKAANINKRLNLVLQTGVKRVMQNRNNRRVIRPALARRKTQDEQ